MHRIWETEALYSFLGLGRPTIKKDSHEVYEKNTLYPFFTVDRKGEVTISNSLK